jgi:hypothetical protein
MKPCAHEAEVLRLLLGYGCVSGEEVIAWANQTIAAAKEKDQNLVALAAIPPDKVEDLGAKLAEIAVGVKKFDALRAALGRVYDVAVKKTPEDLDVLAGRLHIFYDSRNLPGDLKFLYSINDNFYFAKNGIYGDLPAARGKLLENLQYFKDRKFS